MMNNKSIGLMIIAILVMAISVYVHERGNESATDDTVGKLVFPDLKKNLDKVQEIKFTSPSGTTTIERSDKHWTVAEKSDYDASFGKLSDFLNGLADARYVERKTSHPENFSLLGVEGIDNSSSKATEIAVKTEDGTEYSLLIGNKSEGQGGRFARKPGVDQAWLISKLGEVKSDPGSWIDPVVFGIDANQVESVTDTSADGKKVLAVTRDKDGQGFSVTDLPKGAKLKYANIASSLSRGLVNLRITDVRARGEDAWKQAATASYSLKDGSAIVVHAIKDANNQDWVRFDLTPSRKPSEAVKFIDADRLKGFEFRVADYTFDQFTHTMDDMIDKQKPADKDASADKKKASAATH